eukprot:NODE_481_length_2198_cov_28.596091_g443_i0.p1 GENE.NODE_481_length_2198_cov_28.596091_g443_i0~~NODE_481_length_2198_cov_28.596091_g443_i0.p1  ORF type:complete len:699 (-),score=159.35 NODE_481_length_2198_cov_28.596091_g443_i0:53-2149(-)
MRVVYNNALPITSARSKILDLVDKHPVVILVGETGSGKTTQVPQYLAEGLIKRRQATYGRGSQRGKASSHKGARGCAPYRIGITQPRRVAAVTVAKRVAEECAVELGTEVGYAVHFDDQSSFRTVIKYMTEGILLREALSDELLSEYAVVVLDEAHERTLHGDVLAGLLKRLHSRRPDLKIIVMSATLDSASVAQFWGEAPVGYIAGRQFPVTTYYTTEAQADIVDAAVTTVLQVHIQESVAAGDMLVFLTGQDEIEDAQRMLEEKAKQLDHMSKRGDVADLLSLLVIPLYAALPPERQMAAFKPAPKGTRKVVLSTNIAETSVTISGIRYVIDTGMVKARDFNPSTGLDTLGPKVVSKAQARQRAGRAGREASGKCYRLYSEEAFDGFLHHTVPEILRVNLSSVVLYLKSLGIGDIVSFPFMDAPSRDAIVQSLEQLLVLGALDSNLDITPLGRCMAMLPLDPMHAKALIISSRPPFGCLRSMAIVVAMLSVENLFFNPRNEKETVDSRRMQFASVHGDHLTYINLHRAYRRIVQRGDAKQWANEHFINLRAMKKADEVLVQLMELQSQIEEMLGSTQDQFDSGAFDQQSEELMLRKCLTSAFITNAAEWSPAERCYRTIVGRNAVQVHPSSVLFGAKKPPFVLFNTVVQTTQRFMRDVLEVEGKWVLEYGSLLYRKRAAAQRSTSQQPSAKKPNVS